MTSAAKGSLGAVVSAAVGVTSKVCWVEVGERPVASALKEQVAFVVMLEVQVVQASQVVWALVTWLEMTAKEAEQGLRRPVVGVNLVPRVTVR